MLDVPKLQSIVKIGDACSRDSATVAVHDSKETSTPTLWGSTVDPPGYKLRCQVLAQPVWCTRAYSPCMAYIPRRHECWDRSFSRSPATLCHPSFITAIHHNHPGIMAKTPTHGYCQAPVYLPKQHRQHVHASVTHTLWQRPMPGTHAWHNAVVTYSVGLAIHAYPICVCYAWSMHATARQHNTPCHTSPTGLKEFPAHDPAQYTLQPFKASGPPNHTTAHPRPTTAHSGMPKDRPYTSSPVLLSNVAITYELLCGTRSPDASNQTGPVTPAAAAASMHSQCTVCQCSF